MSESEVPAKKINQVITIPIVSDDRNSPEALLMRKAKMDQVQGEVDTKFDTVVERFEAGPQISGPLLSVGVAFSLLLLSALFSGRR